VAPTDPVPIVRFDAKAGERSPDLLRWGLVSYWAKDLKVGFANVNAKAEGIETKPAFRDAFQRRRCLVPVDNFYEWKKTASGKQPYADHSCRSPPDGSGRPVGELALTGRRVGAEFRDCHDNTERAMRRAAQSDAGGSGAGDVAHLARGGAGRPAPTQSHSGALSVGGDDVLAGQPAGLGTSRTMTRT
jgi:hypothetical protein